ncbi:hypothetical protein L0F63_003961 [Massospora cicadina]|nr:hypothetical protein L0F63_003961 [Massospora cicadina]
MRFNIPSSVFEEFEVGKMNPLSKEEMTLMAILSSKPKPFYVIGSTTSALERHAQKLEFVEPHRVKMEASLVSDDKPQGLSSTLIHEISHGLYYLDPEYSRSVRNELGLLGEDINPLFQTLEHLGYHKEVWMDEAAAYLISECQSHPIMALNGIDIGEYPWCKLRNKLQELFSLAYVENLRTSN